MRVNIGQRIVRKRDGATGSVVDITEATNSFRFPKTLVVVRLDDEALRTAAGGDMTGDLGWFWSSFKKEKEMIPGARPLPKVFFIVLGFDVYDMPRSFGTAATVEDATAECERQSRAYVREKARLGEDVTLRLVQMIGDAKKELGIRISKEDF